MASKIQTLIETQFEERGSSKTVSAVERLHSAESRLASTNKKLAVSNSSLTKSFTKMKVGIAAAAAAIVAAGAGFVRLVNNTLDSADKIAKSADKIGITTDALQEYRYAASLAGVETGKLDDALAKFSRNMGELGKASSQTQTTLKDLDPTLLANLKSTRDLSTQLELAFKALRSIEDPARRGAVAVALFGRSGQDLLNMVSSVERLWQRA